MVFVLAFLGTALAIVLWQLAGHEVVGLGDRVADALDEAWHASVGPRVDDAAAGTLGQSALLDPTEAVYVVIAVLVVALIFMRRFADWAHASDKPTSFPPRPARHFTSWLRYQTWAGLYALSAVALFLFAFVFPQFVEFTFRFVAAISGPSTDVPLPPLALEPPDGVDVTQQLVWAAGFLYLMAALPVLEPFVRARFQRWALIPARASELASTICQDFDTFKPSEDRGQRFLKFTGKKNILPTTSVAELVSHDDDGFLELYPRIEYIRWCLRDGVLPPHLKAAMRDYAHDLEDIDQTLLHLRSEIRQFGDALQPLLHPEHAAKLTELHRKLGIDWSLGDPVAVTLFDDALTTMRRSAVAVRGGLAEAPGPALEPERHDALRAVDDTARNRAMELALIDYMTRRLAALRAECERTYRHLVQVVVCTVLGSSAIDPRRTLRSFGLLPPEPEGQRFDLDRLLHLILPAVAVVGLILMGYATVQADTPVIRWTLITLVAYVGLPVLGGYAAATLYLDRKLAMGEEPADLRFDSVALLLAVTLAWSGAMVGFVLVTLVTANPQAHDLGRFYTLPPVVLGVAVAVALFRQRSRRAAFPLWCVAVTCAASVVAAIGSMHLHVRADSEVAVLTALDHWQLTLILTTAVAAGTGLALYFMRQDRSA